MLIIISEVVLLLIAVALPLKSRRKRAKELEVAKKSEVTKDILRYRIDTDTSNANYAVNSFGTLERINRINRDERPEVGS